ncbi:FecCD family ABC transporter permease [Enterococcus sp. CSURQ0835]|uniref:FecCD family ABC transporter permease n=1 Tax=Enterococcus sp. CSURQ0835 TaxID=2681394 RepID=UPI001358945C|nr:iron ABC transporter permease [Enterococcus sp. CSURQ0835]
MLQRRLFFPLVALLLVVGMLASLKYGAVDNRWQDVAGALWDFQKNNPAQQLIHHLRLPRMLGAVLVGAALATAGGLMQGITANPLADSGLLGINAGAGLGLAIVFALTGSPNPLVAILASFCGALVALGFIYLASAKSSFGLQPVKIVLLGAALSTFFSAVSQCISLLFNLNQDLAFWFVGGTGNVSWLQVKLALPLIALGLIGSFLIAPQITLLSLGDDTAISLGKNPALIRRLVMGLVLLLAGTAVSLVGTISFIGLLIPHVVRFFVGYDYRYVIPATALLGACFFVFADIGARLVAPPLETPVGVLVVLIGVPFLLVQLRRGAL